MAYKSVKARHAEVARLVALGTPTKDIAKQTGLSGARVSQLVNTILSDQINDISGARNKSTKELQEQMLKERVELAADIWKELRDEFDEQKEGDGVDMTFAFKVLDRTEGIPAKKIDVTSSGGVFSQEDIDKANAASEGMNEPVGK
jgi:CRISPR/Cas system type I-B associated protein Csh2 (Cas7 group RAMP superfamily)